MTVLEGDTNGDGVADFGIELSGNKTLSTAEFTSGSLQIPLNLVGTAGNDTLTGGAARRHAVRAWAATTR